ncbi:MAG: iron-containing alcohol dehydrogenase [Pseudomonadota bacterium]
MLRPFTSPSVKMIRFEPGASASLAEHIGDLLGRRVLVVTDPRLRQLGLAAGAISSLEASGADVSVFSDVETDPSRGTVEKAAASASAYRATGILGLGGGSSMDVAKLTALLAGSGEDLDDAWGVGNARGPRLPLAAVPTTAGTGSEVSPIAVVTFRDDQKRGVHSPLLIPDAAILDPQLTASLPAEITAATGMDAMVHAIEAFACADGEADPIGQASALEALSLLGQNIETAVREPDNLKARGAMLLGAMLAGQSFGKAPAPAVHALAYPLGARFRISHGLSNALLLPHVLRFNAAGSDDARRIYAALLPHTFPDVGHADSVQAACAAFIDRLAYLSKSLGLETELRQVGIARTDLPTLAAEATRQTGPEVHHLRALSRADALSIYERAY